MIGVDDQHIGCTKFTVHEIAANMKLLWGVSMKWENKANVDPIIFRPSFYHDINGRGRHELCMIQDQSFLFIQWKDKFYSISSHGLQHCRIRITIDLH